MSGVYVHIPFCRTHCTYCGFYSELLRDAWGSERFVSALCREIEQAQSSSVGVSGLPTPPHCWNTLYFGGGTPSLLSLEQMERIVSALGGGSWDEFTVEVNPDDVVRGGRDYADGLRRLGVNRVSMGVQSFDDAVLKRMGRRHNSAQTVQAYGVLREAGLDNISLDFIFGFVTGMDSAALGRALDLLPGGLPEHISCYQLSIEEGSALEKMIRRGIYAMPDDAECERQYYSLCSLLRDMGYEHYEISNWARPGFRSRHNSAYWNHTPYAGFGPGAHSLCVENLPDGALRHVRRWNNPDLSAYLESAESGDFGPVRGGETLSAPQLREERIMLGLRTSDGVPSALVEGKDRGMLVPSEIPDYLRIPEDRWFISDNIITDLI